MKIQKKENGITLIALIITIIVMLILAGIAISAVVGDNGIVNKAVESKIVTAVGRVKEELVEEQAVNYMDETKNATVEQLLADGKVKRTVKQIGDNYYMYYVIKTDAYEGMDGLGKGNYASLRDVFIVDDKFNVKYIDENGKEYGDELIDKILEDETEIRFSSKAFSEYVSKISGVTETEMKFKWMKNQTSLTITDTNVDSLEDLAFFPNLTRLTLGDYSKNSPKVTTLDGVENCTKLENIQIIYGPDKDYSALTNLQNLTSFYRYAGTDFDSIIDSLKFCEKVNSFSFNNGTIQDMSRVYELGDLSSLTLYSNQITKIEGLENKPSLTSLTLLNNKITQIEGLENMTNLEALNLSCNKIIEVEGLENLSNLKILNLEKNLITDITPLSANSSTLTTLDLKGNSEIDGDRNNYTGERLESLNKIGEILDRGGTINIDIDKLGLFTNYKKLNLSSQKLTTLEPLEGLTELTELNLQDNQLTLEDEKSQDILKSMTMLKSLDLRNNKITNITAINSLKNLKDLNLKGPENNINLVEIEDIISNLSILRVSTESLKTIINCDVNKITKLYLNNSDLTEIPDLSIFTKLVELNLSSNPNISDFSTISNITSLQTLNLSGNDLHERMIDFSQLINLTSLNLSNNTLWSEDLENLKALRNNKNLSIDLSNNSIIDASALLELDPSCKINLKNNVNLSQESKDALKERFGSNVSY